MKQQDPREKNKLQDRRQSKVREADAEQAAPKREAILSSLKQGPVARELPLKQRPVQLLMVWDHLRNGGSWSSLSVAGLNRPVYLMVLDFVFAGTATIGVGMWETPPPPAAYHGVGLYVSAPLVTDSGGHALEILAVLPDTPAAAAGLQPGDLILAIGGISISGDPPPSLRGAAGSVVVLHVLREGVSTEETITLTRATIPEAHVENHPEGSFGQAE